MDFEEDTGFSNNTNEILHYTVSALVFLPVIVMAVLSEMGHVSDEHLDMLLFGAIGFMFFFFFVLGSYFKEISAGAIVCKKAVNPILFLSLQLMFFLGGIFFILQFIIRVIL